ncbi:MAG TPA: prepilin-type N-terminal cleavage/methylation domain-containing protein [Opitutaceae bacterium]
MKRDFYAVRAQGFSLIEVVIAVAVFAGSIVAILGLLGPTLQTTREVIDSAVAARLADGINEELNRVGFDFVKGATSPPGEGETANPLELFAIADGSRVAEKLLANSTTDDRAIALPDRYFRIIVRQLAEPAPSDVFVALNIRVEWPFRLPDGTSNGVENEPTERRWFSFNTSARP